MAIFFTYSLSHFKWTFSQQDEVLVLTLCLQMLCCWKTEVNKKDTLCELHKRARDDGEGRLRTPWNSASSWHYSFRPEEISRMLWNSLKFLNPLPFLKDLGKKQFRNGLLFAGTPLLWVPTVVLLPRWSSHRCLGGRGDLPPKATLWLAGCGPRGAEPKTSKPASPPGLARLPALSLSQLPCPLVCPCCFPEALYLLNSSNRDKPIPMVTETQKMSRVCSSGHPQPVSVEASLTLAQLGAQGWDTFGD